MNQIAEKIERLLCYCFQNNTDEHNFTDKPDFDFYIENNLIISIEKESKTFIVNFDSNLLNDELLKIAEIDLKKELPSEIKLALNFVNDFEQNIKEKYPLFDSNPNFATYKKHFKTFIINKFEYNLIEEYYSVILKNKKIDRKEKNDYVETFFKYLEIYNPNEEVILNSCYKYYKSEKYPSNYIFNILSNIAKTNHFFAVKLVDYILNKKFND
ncbi:MAG: hypothetical protein ABI549_04330 [Flavobacterium sp.]|uniref:hypothetical protein n=1 Tax=Flavobacterium sp. TaxID=239 RepID=UPI003264AEDD